MKISIVADELSNDPDTAFELGLEWGVSRFELRGVFGERVPRLSPHSRHRLLRSVKGSGVEITAISPGLFKFPFPAGEPAPSNLAWMDATFFAGWSQTRAMLADHLDNLLPQALDFAGEVGAAYLIAFSFHRNGATADEAPQGVIETIARAGEAAAALGIELLIETEEGHWANSGPRSAELVRRAGPACIGINWDPANALIDGETPFPDGYHAVRGFVRNVHFKDARRFADGSWILIDRGDVDWPGQIAALAADGYDGAIAVEPHLMPAVASTRRALERLRSLISQASKREATNFQPDG